ncbi:NACHT domain-containing protein [Actinomadura syzygii]|uniref:NACHT domain-containing protein n=1 Tax=Actinomadura syzygii TaxID=1427538 RepID=UPI0016526873|nr:NACHT domain-containing protein [Actinomadura syzygii]
MRPRRLVLTGPPGSGKTTAAFLLVRDLLAHRAPGEPVPVLVPMATWDPAQRPFEDWLAEQIAETYPLSSAAARDLVGRRQVIPILDGFDELPVQKAGQALRRMNAVLHEDDPLVVVGRDAALGLAVRSRQGENLQRATVLRLEPVTPAQVVRYLEGILPQAEYPGWDRWREQLVRESGAALGWALSRPAAIGLVRAAYLDARIPLPDLGSLTASQIIERLYSDWIERLYPAGEKERLWLSRVARLTERDNTGFMWWRLYRLQPRWARVLSVGVLDAVVGSTLMAACYGAGGPSDVVSDVAGARWLALMALAGLWDEFAKIRNPVPRRNAEPRAWLRRRVLLRGGVAVVTGAGVGLMTGFLGPEAGPRTGLFLGVWTAWGVMLASAVWFYAMTVAVLAVRGALPFRPLSFLERARRQGVMRAMGGAYQFRLREIQDLLAAPEPDRRVWTPPGPGQPQETGPRIGDGVTRPDTPAVLERSVRESDPSYRRTPRPAPPPVSHAPDGDAPVSRPERLDVFAREAVLREVLVLPEVLRRVDQRSPLESRARLRALAASLLDDDPLAVESPARDRGQRFDEALQAFEKAADLPFLSRFGTAYLVAAGSAGTALVGLFAARSQWPWVPDAIFATSVALLLSVFLWVSFRRHAAQRRALRSRDPAEWLQLDELPHLRLVLDRTYRDWIRAMARDGLLPLLTARLGEDPPTYTTELHGLELEPLSGTDDRDDHFVETAASRHAALLIEELSSASIGISGARGAGKSTVLRQLCDPERHPDDDLRLLVHAPTAYDSREFLTHLFVRVCERIVGDQAPKPAPARRIRMLTMKALPWASIVAGLALIVGTLYRGRIRDLVRHLPDGARVYLLVTGGVLIVAGLAVALLLNRRPQLRSMTRAQVSAYAHLRRLRYQQAVTRTSLGELGLPGGAKAGGQFAVQQTEQSQSLPGMVSDLKELLTLVGTERRADRNKVVIGVDELDKIATAGEAEQFLNDLKVIFGVPGCYFLVTVSEDALAAFGRRTLSVRDTFDSAFDTVVAIPPLRGNEALALLSRRGVPLPAPYVWLCHVMTAGLARDLIRLVRGLAAASAEGVRRPRPDGTSGEARRDLAYLAHKMIARDVAEVMEAQLRGAAAAEEEGTAVLLEWLAACADVPIASALLEASVADMPEHGLSLNARTFAVQTRAYLAITAILVRLFVENPSESANWLRDLAGRPDEQHPLDRLAEIRGLLANHPQLAWHAVLRLRREAAWPVSLPPFVPSSGS